MRLIHFTIPVMVLILLSMFVTAVDESPIMDGSQSTILADDDLFKPLADLIRPIFTKINVIVGGLFGLYIILIIIRAYYERKKLKVLQDIRFDIDQLNRHYHLPTSRSRKGPLQQFMASLFRKRLSRDKTYSGIVKKK